MTSDAITERMVFLRGRNSADRFVCGSLARRFGLTVGMSSRAAEELAIAASELGSNVTRHADEGLLVLRFVEHPRPHVVIECRDRGPGIPDIDAARVDGFSEGRLLAPDDRRHRGFGRGFGAIERLVDEFAIQSIVEVGTCVTVKKWVR